MMRGAKRLQETAKRALPRRLSHRRVDALLYHFLFAGDAYPDLRPPVHLSTFCHLHSIKIPFFPLPPFSQLSDRRLNRHSFTTRRGELGKNNM